MEASPETGARRGSVRAAANNNLAECERRVMPPAGPALDGAVMADLFQQANSGPGVPQRDLRLPAGVPSAPDFSLGGIFRLAPTLMATENPEPDRFPSSTPTYTPMSAGAAMAEPLRTCVLSPLAGLATTSRTLPILTEPAPGGGLLQQCARKPGNAAGQIKTQPSGAQTRREQRWRVSQTCQTTRA